MAICQAPQACNVPAFRYALERWPADHYRVVVYHQSVPRGAEFTQLSDNAAERGGLANYSLQLVDVTEPDGKAMADRHKIAAFPWLEVYYPAPSEARNPIWSERLSADAATKIVQSRIRTRLVERLLAGDVAVWVLVKSGHEAKDRRALDVLTAAVKKAAATLRMPETGTDLNGDPIAVTDYRTYPVRFAQVEIARDDPNEQLLVRALLNSESDLEQYDEPMAFPVFGRGRALYALVGDGIQERTILEACESLIGWCSCEIKAQNPGTDLLISADWSRPFGGKMVKDPEVPLTGLSGFVPAQSPSGTQAKGGAEAVAESAAAVPAPASCSVAPSVPNTAAATEPADGPIRERPIWRNLLYLAGSAGVLLLAFSLVLVVRRK